MAERVLSEEQAKKMDIDYIYNQGNKIAITDNHKRCFFCSKIINHRGFCSEKCHNYFYDKYHM